MKGTEMRIEIVPDQACPRCGAYWGHPDPALDFPNRVKVDDLWRCYNPECTVGYYKEGRVHEDKPTPEEAAAIQARVSAEVDALMATSRWVSRGNTSRLIPNGEPVPAGWTEGP